MTFHFLNLSFCLFYASYHLILLLNPSICECDPTNVLFPVYLTFYLAMWDVFLRHWRRVTLKAGEVPEQWQIRSFIYVVVAAVFTALHSKALLQKPCSRSEFYFKFGQPFGAITVPITLYIVADAVYLAVRCHRRMVEVQEESGEELSPQSLVQLGLFIALPVSMLLAPIVENLSLAGQFLYFLVPSVVMLYLMWSRQYIDLRTDWKDLEDAAATASTSSFNESPHSAMVMSSHSRALHASSRSLRSPLLAAATDSASVDSETPSEQMHRALRAESVTIAGIAQDIRTTLTVVAPLNSELHFKRGLLRGADDESPHGQASSPWSPADAEHQHQHQQPHQKPLAAAPSSSSVFVGAHLSRGGIEALAASGVGASSTPSVESGGPGSPELAVAETLLPPSSTFVLLRAFLADIALPPLERVFAEHKKLTAALLGSARPEAGSSEQSVFANMAGSMQRKQQYKELVDQCNEMSMEFSEFLVQVSSNILRAEMSKRPLLEHGPFNSLQ